MASDDEDVPDSGAVFTFGRSRFVDNKFWIRDDAVIHLACGDEHSAVLTENGKLYTFGSNDWGQLGHGNTVQFPSPKLVKRLKPEKVRLVAAGRNHTIVSTESGKLFSFGCGSDGQLGHGNYENSNVPKAIESLPDQQYKIIACGSDFSAAATAEGQFYTWGSNSEGQTGQGSEDWDLPTKVHLRGKVVAVACGYYHMAVATDDGTLYMCGENESGKLGLEDSQLRDTSHLQKLFINERVTAVACGGNHTAAVTASGKLYTFGQGDHGQLGHGSSCLECPTPKQVTSLGNIQVRYVACGESHTAVVTKHGNLYTCGDGRHGKLGMGEESFSNLFKLEKVTRFDGFTVQKAACGGCHTLVTAIKTTEVSEGTDSEAEAEKDILATSISSTKSLQDAVDGPPGYRTGLASTFPAGGAARNKRRQRNIESLANSLGGGSLPPINKSTLPPLSRALPALKKEPTKEEKIPVNPLDMSTLPKISHDGKVGDDKKTDGNLADKRQPKVSKPSEKPKDAESSSGVSESEEEEDDDDEDEDQHKTKNDKTPVAKEEKKKEDTKKTDEESEESLTQDETDSEEEEPSKPAKSTTEKEDKKEKVPSKKEKDQEEDEESEDDEESDDEEDDDESSEERTKTDKNEQLKVVGKKIEVKKVETKKEEEEEDDDDEEESEEEESEEEEEENKKTKEQKKSEAKEKETKPATKKKETEEESEEEDEDEDEDEEEEESEGEKQTKDAEKDKKEKEKVETKDKKSKKEKKQSTEDSDKKKADDKKGKKKDTKRKDKESEEEEEEDEANKEEETDKEKGDKEEERSKNKKEKKDKKEDGAGKAESGKTKEKKSGICLIL